MAKPILQEEIKDNNVDISDIEQYVYLRYPDRKQVQDDKWTARIDFIFDIKDIKDGKKKIAEYLARVEAGEKLDDVVSLEDKQLEFLFKKGVKIALRNNWLYSCLEEYYTAKAESREAKYPEFPEV